MPTRKAPKFQDDLVLRRNNCAVHESCAKCGEVSRADVPLMAAIEGSERWVCLRCFEKHIGIPGAAVLIDYLNGILDEPRRPAGEKLEAFLCNLDGVRPGSPKPDESDERFNRDDSTDQRASQLLSIARELTKYAGELNKTLSPQYRAFMTGAYGGVLSDPNADACQIPF